MSFAPDFKDTNMIIDQAMQHQGGAFQNEAIMSKTSAAGYENSRQEKAPPLLNQAMYDGLGNATDMQKYR